MDAAARRSATHPVDPKSFGCCMACRSPFLPYSMNIGVDENVDIIRLDGLFQQKGGNIKYRFCSDMKKGHVFQVAHVQHALKWWDGVLAGLGHTFEEFSGKIGAGVGVPGGFNRFDCPGTNIKVSLGTYATWKCPTAGIEFPSLVSRILLRGNIRIEVDAGMENDLDNTVYPVCSSCNAVMDSDMDQRDVLSDGSSPIVSVEAISIYVPKKRTPNPFPSQGDRDSTRKYRHVLIAYYIHACLLGLSKEEYDGLQKRKCLGLYTRLCYLMLMVVAKQRGMTHVLERRQGAFIYQGQLDFYISFVSYLLLRHNNFGSMGSFDFFRYHILYVLEVPRCVYIWPEGKPKKLSWWVFEKDTGEKSGFELLRIADTRVCDFAITAGAVLKGLMCGEVKLLTLWLTLWKPQYKSRSAPLDAPRKVTQKDLENYFCTSQEGERLMTLQKLSGGAVAGTQQQNPGLFVHGFGCTAMMLYFYYNIPLSEKPLKDATWDMIHRWVEKEWVNMRTLEKGWQKTDQIKLAYNIAFCAEAREALEKRQGKPCEGGFMDVVKTMVRVFTQGSLEKFLQTTPLCSVWKTSLRLMDMHACLLFVDMLEEDNTTLFQKLKITEKGDEEDTDKEDTSDEDSE